MTEKTWQPISEMDPYLSIDVNRFPVIAAVPSSGMNYKDALSLKQGTAHLCNQITKRFVSEEVRLYFSCSISQEIRKPLICLGLLHLASLWQKGIKQIFFASAQLNFNQFEAKRQTLSGVASFPPASALSPPSLVPLTPPPLPPSWSPPPPLPSPPPPWSSQPSLSSPGRNQQWRQPRSSGNILYTLRSSNCVRHLNSPHDRFILRIEHFIACPKYLDVSYNFKCF